MPDEKPRPEATQERPSKMLTGEHEVKIGGVVVMRRGEQVSKEELADRISRAAEEHFRKHLRKRDGE